MCFGTQHLGPPSCSKGGCRDRGLRPETDWFMQAQTGISIRHTTCAHAMSIAFPFLIAESSQAVHTKMPMASFKASRHEDATSRIQQSVQTNVPMASFKARRMLRPSIIMARKPRETNTRHAESKQAVQTNRPIVHSKATIHEQAIMCTHGDEYWTFGVVCRH